MSVGLGGGSRFKGDHQVGPHGEEAIEQRLGGERGDPVDVQGQEPGRTSSPWRFLSMMRWVF